MAAAANLARQGSETHLVEREPELGGTLRHLDTLWPSGLPAREVLRGAREDLLQAGVHVHLNTEVEVIGGYVGNFSVRLRNGEELQVGAVILATGAQPYTPTEFRYGQDPRVITNLELERVLHQVDAHPITFVSCVGSRQGPMGCSRYCCASMIGQALALRRRGKHVRVLSKYIRTYSRQAEELYEQAMREGVFFLRYASDLPPQEAIHFEDGVVRFRDELSGATVHLPTDLLVLVVGLRPETLTDQLKLAHSEDGFFLELHPKLGPAETAVQGVYLAGAAQAPKDVRDTVSQALAAAAKAGGLLSRGSIGKEPLTAVVDPDRCIGCMLCVPACPFGAIEMPYFTKEQILAQIDAALADRPQEKVLVFACNWCSYAGADQAGIEKLQYPPSARIIRTMCSVRVEHDFVVRAFERGAGAVLITGCRLTEQGSDCHYNYANRHTAKRFELWKKKFVRQGVAPERFQLQWISASEGKLFASKMAEMHRVVQEYCRQLAAARGSQP
ncbi:MAG: hydrogenase iron-sulfur subunit [Armatimonadetes bacterium]|nr:hydrogenase iron-sulfur subunit [Armatimonadota bacterium]MDW8152709.1 hydrogenase iron-sulfur subunit [Armatimonadota bacterium]